MASQLSIPGKTPAERHEVPSEFCALFGQMSPQEAIYLYRSFKLWVKNNMREVYKAFASDLKRRQERARQSMEREPLAFPNAKKGVPYACAFALPAEVSHVQFPDLSHLGLKFRRNPVQPALWALSGKPTQAGEFEISFYYQWAGWVPPLEKLKETIRLVVNPDPRELWKNIPVDREIEYYKEASAASCLEGDGAIMLGASIRGRSHAHKGSPRDDDFLLLRDEASQWHILAVADGAGSAPFSRKGSELACKAAASSCQASLAQKAGLDSLLAENPDYAAIAQVRKLAYNILPQAALEGFKAIRCEAEFRGRDPKAYATTLLLAIAKKYHGHWAIISFQVGDGAMAVLEGGDSPRATLLAEPDEGEFGGQTRFITMRDIFSYDDLMKRLNVCIAPDFRALLMMSDGVSDPRLPSVATLNSSSAWLGLWDELKPLVFGPEPATALLEWLEFWSPGNHDDRTLAVLALRDGQ